MSDRVACPVCLAPYRAGFVRCPRDGAALVAGADPLIGAVIAGRYRIEAAIGEGGLGVVYRAHHVRMSRRYAIKVPFGDLAADPRARERFAREAEAACRLSHPNVVAALDAGETAGGLLYLVMELAEGPSLAEVLAAGPLEPARALAIVAQIARGLAHAHACGLVHRDLKPGNVILEAGDRARIVDFGIALVLADGSTRLTARGLVVGTPRYMAPEQALGEAVDARADTFALGLVAYELLAGVLPHDGDGLEVALRYLAEPLPPVAARAPGARLAPAIDALLARMLAADPAARPAGAAEIAEEAARLAGARARPARPCGAMRALRP